MTLKQPYIINIGRGIFSVEPLQIKIILKFQMIKWLFLNKSIKHLL